MFLNKAPREDHLLHATVVHSGWVLSWDCLGWFLSLKAWFSWSFPCAFPDFFLQYFSKPSSLLSAFQHMPLVPFILCPEDILEQAAPGEKLVVRPLCKQVPDTDKGSGSFFCFSVTAGGAGSFSALLQTCILPLHGPVLLAPSHNR